MSLKNHEIFTKSLSFATFAAFALFTQLATAALPPSPGETLTLEWNAVSEPDLQDYRVYVGTQTGQYTRTLDAGTATSVPIDQLEVGQTYYLAVTAIGSTGEESPPSAELVVTIATPPVPTGAQLSPNETGGLALQWTFPSSAMGSSPDFIVQASSDLVNWTEVATVLAENSLGGDGQLEHFSWPVPTTADERKFYRLTARNWLGSSTTP
ncbi:MAG: fibronectin type III domain-containing protein [Verrucomicrobiota bacterium]